MRFSRLAAYAAFAGSIWAGLAHNIALKAHTRECFYEELHKDDKMTVTFQVGDREFGGAGNLEIDFYVRWPYIPENSEKETDYLSHPDHRSFRFIRNTVELHLFWRLFLRCAYGREIPLLL